MRILQISCSYFPDKVGGTELYVHNLNRELLSRGHQVFVNYVEGFYAKNGPEVRTKEYIFDRIPIFAIEKNAFGSKTSQLYFDSQEEIYPLFKEYLTKTKPDIVHFHHFSPVDVISQMKVAKEMKLPVILTYHTPMMTCGHADMLYLGKRICNGRIDYKRCLICAQTKYGIPKPLAFLWANLPRKLAQYLGISISKMNVKGCLATWLQLPWFTRERIERWKSEFGMIDHFVAVCHWVYNLLLINGIPKEKITLSRQGISLIPPVIKKQKDDVLRLGYLGRIHSVKGIDVLLKTFKSLPSEYKIELYIYGLVQQPDDNRYYIYLRRLSHNDVRIKWLGILSEEKDKFQALSQMDILVIPSRWLETGPLVLLEAWAVGTPIIGARLGGIAESVTEGKGGLLFTSEDTQDLAQVITRIYTDPDLLRRLKLEIPQVRTTREVADDMEKLYNRLR